MKRFRVSGRWLCLVLLLGASAMLEAGAETTAPDTTALSVEGAWSRPGLPDRPAAAYLTLVNHGAGPDRLIGVASPAFDRVSLHATVRDGDVVSMEPLDAVDVAPGETVAFTPGERHIMLTGGPEVFAEGEGFPLILTFEQAGEVAVEVRVTRHGPATEPDQHKDH